MKTLEETLAEELYAMGHDDSPHLVAWCANRIADACHPGEFNVYGEGYNEGYDDGYKDALEERQKS